MGGKWAEFIQHACLNAGLASTRTRRASGVDSADGHSTISWRRCFRRSESQLFSAIVRSGGLRAAVVARATAQSMQAPSSIGSVAAPADQARTAVIVAQYTAPGSWLRIGAESGAEIVVAVMALPFAG